MGAITIVPHYRLDTLYPSELCHAALHKYYTLPYHWTLAGASAVLNVTKVTPVAILPLGLETTIGITLKSLGPA